MIKVLNASYERVAILKNVLSCSLKEELNGAYTLDFEVVLDDKVLNLVTEASYFEVNEDYFETNKIQWVANENGSKTVKIGADHISYKLNEADYNLEYYAQTGTPTFILNDILDGTGFTAGTVEFTDPVTFSIQEKKSRRLTLMEFVASLEGEVIFNKFEIGIVSHRGSSDPKPVLKDRNVKVISKTINKRKLDDDGNPITSYGCTPTYLPNDTYVIGDDVVLLQKELGLAEALRVVKIEFNPYDRSQTKLTFANYFNGLENSVYKIITDSVVKDKIYNGCRIGPEYGFEVVRSDNLSRAFFRSDGFKIQQGDGGGVNWDDVFYIDGDGNLIMQGAIKILSIDGTGTIIDEYGIDPKFLDYSKNLVWNSSFEISDATDKPFHWSGGVCSGDSSFYGSKSLKLEPTDITRQHWAASIDPDWLDRQVIRASFYANFVVDFKVRVVDLGTWVATAGVTKQYYELTSEDGLTTGTELSYSGSNGWEDSRITFTFDSDEFADASARFALEFENVDALGDIYIDGVMMHPDFTGKWAQLYKNGPRSESLVNAGDAFTDSPPLSASVPTQEYNKVVISDTAPDDLTVGWVDIS